MYCNVMLNQTAGRLVDISGGKADREIGDEIRVVTFRSFKTARLDKRIVFDLYWPGVQWTKDGLTFCWPRIRTIYLTPIELPDVSIAIPKEYHPCPSCLSLGKTSPLPETPF